MSSIPVIKVESYQGGIYPHQGETYHLCTESPYMRLEDATAFANFLTAKWKGWKFPIILNSAENSLYYVYINHTPKKQKTFTIEDVRDDPAQARYPVASRDRLVHIKSMYAAGQRGIRDMSALSKQLIHPPPDKTLSHTDISPDHDIVGFDQPRKDICVSETASGKMIRAGADTLPIRDWLTTSAKRVLNNNFTKGEVRKMNLYFEGRAKLPDKTAGTCATFKEGKMPVSIISLGPGYITEDVLTHEVVHALRAVDGRVVQDRDMDEIETDYETKLRVQNPLDEYEGTTTGYYGFIPRVKEGTLKISDAIRDDRFSVFADFGGPSKGRRLTHNIVPNTVKHSRIATAKPALHEYHETRYGVRQMIAEDVDTYFQIKLPDKTTTEYHIRFDEARPSLTKIKKHLKAKFGKNIEAWEWQDGKRVRLISRPKQTRSRKRATKKRTSAKKRMPAKKRTTMKKRTPAKKPVAAKRYGLDAILGVPEGIL